MHIAQFQFFLLFGLKDLFIKNLTKRSILLLLRLARFFMNHSLFSRELLNKNKITALDILSSGNPGAQSMVLQAALP